MNTLLIIIGKLISLISKSFNLGHGSTWPGHIALNINKNFIRGNLQKSSIKIILIAGTNGKTTTAKLIRSILEENGNTVFQNESGANLLNGIASALIRNSDISGNLNYDYAIFEVDENSLPLVLKELIPSHLLLLNLFRDQLDRYGEVNSIALKWSKAIQQLNNLTILVLNADDPQIAYLGLSNPNVIASEAKQSHLKIFYFGLNDPKLAQTSHQHAADSTYCPNCGTKLNYKVVYYSHVGEWSCPKCKLKRPQLDATLPPFYPLPGIYNRYNTNAAVLLARLLDLKPSTINRALTKFEPAFGRQEKLNLNGKSVQIFLSKNPTSFNESLRTAKTLGAKHALFVLNDRIPDGRDVSWIWDVDFESYTDSRRLFHVSGDRVFDMALRVKYADIKLTPEQIHTDLAQGIKKSLEQTPEKETLYILPTYSAMLETRKILTGKKIL